MSIHPSLGEIFDAVRRNAATAHEIAPHLSSCGGCRESAAWVESLLAATASGPLPEPPEEVIARAVGIGRAEPRTVERDALRPLWSIARLLHDSLTSPALVGVRGRPASRRLLYEVDGAHLDLEVSPSMHDAGRSRLIGQLLVTDAIAPDDVLVMLWRGLSIAAEVCADEFGQFVLDGIEPGDYRLDVWSPSMERAIRVAPLSIEAGGQ